jgi:hypothetical protein
MRIAGVFQELNTLSESLSAGNLIAKARVFKCQGTFN